MKKKSILLRLNESTYAALDQAASNTGISRTEMLRTFLIQGLAGYDRKHEDVIAYFETLERDFSKSYKLLAINTAMVAALEIERKKGSQFNEISANLDEGRTLCESGLLTQRQKFSCEGAK